MCIRITPVRHILLVNRFFECIKIMNELFFTYFSHTTELNYLHPELVGFFFWSAEHPLFVFSYNDLWVGVFLARKYAVQVFFNFFLFYRTSSLQSFVTEFIQNIFLGQVHATVSSSIAAATKGKQLCSYIELSILTYHTWFINKQTIILISIINIRMVFVSESETNKLRSFIHSFQIIDNHI